MPNPAVLSQSAYDVRLAWSAVEADVVRADVAVVVDVLSFTTTVSVAVEAGAAVLPYRWRDDGAAAYAREQGAVLAVGRSQGGPGRPSLSPAGMRGYAAAGQRIVLPSPNGATIAHGLADRSAVVAGSLRNAGLVGSWLATEHPGASVVVVAAGERWPDGSLRPAVEDLWGAGAVLDALVVLGRDGLSPEAAAARAAYAGARATLAQDLRACASGRELVESGYAADVDVAAELDAGAVVPVLRDGAFVAATLTP